MVKTDICNKKGVSPLIATILLIAFAIALGTVVLNWGINFDISKDKCISVELKIRDISGYEVCYTSDGKSLYLNFVLDNTGNMDIDGLAVWVIGKSGTQLSEFHSIGFKKGSLFEKRDKEMSYDLAKYGEIRQIQFVPNVEVEDILDVCTKNSVKTNKIDECQ